MAISVQQSARPRLYLGVYVPSLRHGQVVDVEIDLELDTQPRTVEVPSDLAAALDADAGARRTWDTLSYSQQRWHVLHLEGAKAAATRQRRLDASIAALSEGRDR